MSGQTLTGQVFSTDHPISEKQGGERTVGVKPFKSRQIILHENIKSRPDPPPPTCQLAARSPSAIKLLAVSVFFFKERKNRERERKSNNLASCLNLLTDCRVFKNQVAA